MPKADLVEGGGIMDKGKPIDLQKAWKEVLKRQEAKKNGKKDG